MVNYRDITERIFSEQKLKEQAQFLAEEKSKAEALLTSISDPLVATDHSGRIIAMNRAVEENFDLDPKLVAEKPFYDLVPFIDFEGKLLPREERPLALSLRTNQTVVKQVVYLEKDGTKKYYEVKSSPIAQGNSIIGAICIFHDITAEKEIENAKSEFVSLASHQLRTPLSITKWYVETLQTGGIENLTANQKKYIQEIESSTERMSGLVNSLLNLSRLDLGTFLIDPKPLDIKEFAKKVVLEVSTRFAAKQQKIVENYAQDLSVINLDQVITNILLENLLSNALKYSPEKSQITLEIKLVAKGEKVAGEEISTDSLLIGVSDQGFGIPKEQQARVFDKFFRGSNVTSKDVEGTGLGLYMVKRMVEEVGGRIWFKSIENQGTTFYLTIPKQGMKKKEGKKLVKN